MLISPLSVRGTGDKILVDLTQAQVKDSPPVETDKPVNRQQEEAIAEEMPARERETALGDPSLRSTRDVTGYYIAAPDGDIGHVADFLIDDRAWAIRYLVVDPVTGGPARTGWSSRRSGSRR
ncbi:MAG TPA: hypothetical protein VFO08_19775 [Methylomirabilota bacterium]|nr:hypothetical protein [Methylomirabilota bacterium]